MMDDSHLVGFIILCLMFVGIHYNNPLFLHINIVYIFMEKVSIFTTIYIYFIFFTSTSAYHLENYIKLLSAAAYFCLRISKIYSHTLLTDEILKASPVVWTFFISGPYEMQSRSGIFPENKPHSSPA